MQWKWKAGKPPAKYIVKQASTLVRPNSKDHIAVAMAMRPQGATQQEIITILGHPHRNVIKKLLAENKVRQITLPDLNSRSTRIKLIKN